MYSDCWMNERTTSFQKKKKNFNDWNVSYFGRHMYLWYQCVILFRYKRSKFASNNCAMFDVNQIN